MTYGDRKDEPNSSAERSKEPPSVPILDLSWTKNTTKRLQLLQQLHSALFNVGFLYITGHNIEQTTINNLVDFLPNLFALPSEEKAALSKLNSPHFLGYSGFAEETTLGKQDLREQFDFATELSAVQTPDKPYWRLRGPNQWPSEPSLPGFRKAFLDYHDAVENLSYRFVHLIEEAFGVPLGTFDLFFNPNHTGLTNGAAINGCANPPENARLRPQHRIKLLRYPPSLRDSDAQAQGVGAHKDSSGWLTFLYQVGNEPGLEVLSSSGKWLPVPPVPNSFVVNFGNAFEAATEGAVKATIHRVIAPGPDNAVRYSIPFFQGLPLDMTVSQIRSYVPETVRALRKYGENGEALSGEGVSSFLDPRWDSLGESQLRKWIRSHRDVGLKWYGQEMVNYYTQ